MILELDWHIPWEAEWDVPKKNAAAEKLASYIKGGTIYETKTRMRVTVAEVMTNGPGSDPYLRLRLEH